MTARRFSCPAESLAAEIEFAIVYLAASNPGRKDELLLPPPRGCRDEFAGLIAVMLLERAENGLSGMSLEGADTPAEKR